MTDPEARTLHTDPEVRLETDYVIFPETRVERSRVRSAHVDQVASAATGPIVMCAVGLICLLSMGGEGGAFRAGAGGILLGAAGIWWSQKKPTFRLTLRLEDEEISVFEHGDEATVQAIRSAVDGLIAR